MQDQLSEVWVISGLDNYLPIYLIAPSVGDMVSLALQESKKGWLSASCKLDIHALADLSLSDLSLSDELVIQVT